MACGGCCPRNARRSRPCAPAVVWHNFRPSNFSTSDSASTFQHERHISSNPPCQVKPGSCAVTRISIWIKFPPQPVQWYLRLSELYYSTASLSCFRKTVAGACMSWGLSGCCSGDESACGSAAVKTVSPGHAPRVLAPRCGLRLFGEAGRTKAAAVRRAGRVRRRHGRDWRLLLRHTLHKLRRRSRRARGHLRLRLGQA